VSATCVHYIKLQLRHLNINYFVVKITLYLIIGISNKPPQTFIALSYDELNRVKAMTFRGMLAHNVNVKAAEGAP
jgi:hypothetical protein